MLAILPLIALILLALIIQQKGDSWRGAFLTAAIAWGTLLTAITELLSAVHWLSFSGVLVSWSAVCILAGLFYTRLRRRDNRTEPLTSQFEISDILKLQAFPLVWLAGLGFILLMLGTIAIVAPPNTWDSMTYHMSRAMHWMQNHSVAHYPTYNLPQLFHPPFAEFAIMHLQILSGGDRFANLVQWFSMVGSVLGVSLIAQQLGANTRGQILAAVLVATLPMGMLQSTSTQNDYAVCFWIVCLAHCVLQSVQTKLDLTQSAKVGASVGLAILTKSSGYIHAFPFLVWLFLAKVQQSRWKFWKFWKPLLVIVVLMLALNLNHYLRNLDLFGTPLGTPSNFTREYKMEIYGLPALISNIVRNLSLHVDIVRYFNLQGVITPLTGIIEKMIRLLHSLLGLDMNDSRTTFPDQSYRVPGISFDENVAGNPLHLLLIAGAIVLFLMQKHLRTQKLLLAYGLTVIGAFLLFCIMLKVQPYQSRHHLALFVLFSAFIGVVFSQALNYRIVNILAVVILVSSLPWAFKNTIRPVLGAQNVFNTSRIEQYFKQRPQLIQPYTEGVDFIRSKSCTNVGLSLGTGITVGNDYWEYPLWHLFGNTNAQADRLEHINMKNISIRKSETPPHDQFDPCAIFVVRTKEEPLDSKTMTFRHKTFTQAWSNPPVSIFVVQ
ncbi:MAG: hypothetical protein KME16_08480 [Scytolyngbya sp. HA4215-MV1]|jgi:4-amino-4-deoxy-L-arabinose transferase-like glycosyltransferase|nr:hypothetical protein [Scytolyngbya sp. HA4215-MV1]